MRPPPFCIATPTLQITVEGLPPYPLTLVPESLLSTIWKVSKRDILMRRRYFPAQLHREGVRKLLGLLLLPFAVSQVSLDKMRGNQDKFVPIFKSLTAAQKWLTCPKSLSLDTVLNITITSLGGFYTFSLYYRLFCLVILQV